VKDLRASGNQLTELPALIGQLKQLKTLHLSRNHVGRTTGGQLPPEIGECLFLEELLIDQNELTDLPLELGILTSLDSLKIDGEKLNCPPQEIIAEGTGRILGYLRRLYNARTTNKLDLSRASLGHNGLIVFPMEVLQLTRLTSFKLTDNRLKELPLDFNKLSELKTLDLKGNLLGGLPYTMSILTSLSSLDVRENKMTRLPLWLGNNTLLTDLKVCMSVCMCVDMCTHVAT
jgi:Leucine-rich repeat (LRR) protein